MAPAPVPASVVRQADLLRITGNECYKKGRIGAAIDAYTESIVLFPNVAACWTNRAQCFRKKREWGRVEEDCKKAIALDTNSVKGHYLLGLALLERQEYVVGIKELEKAFDLARGANPASHLVEEIWQCLAKAKYMNWELESNKRLWKLQKLKGACEEALMDRYMKDASPAEETTRTSTEQLEFLAQVFDKAGASDKPAEVPDYLCCKITLDIFRDPVITPGGITYEKTVILDHLRKVGGFDPVTREPLDERQLVPNLAIKEAVRAFLDEHGWAYKNADFPTVILE